MRSSHVTSLWTQKVCETSPREVIRTIQHRGHHTSSVVDFSKVYSGRRGSILRDMIIKEKYSGNSWWSMGREEKKNRVPKSDQKVCAPRKTRYSGHQKSHLRLN